MIKGVQWTALLLVSVMLGAWAAGAHQRDYWASRGWVAPTPGSAWLARQFDRPIARDLIRNDERILRFDQVTGAELQSLESQLHALPGFRLKRFDIQADSAPRLKITAILTRH